MERFTCLPPRTRPNSPPPPLSWRAAIATTPTASMAERLPTRPTSRPVMAEQSEDESWKRLQTMVGRRVRSVRMGLQQAATGG